MTSTEEKLLNAKVRLCNALGEYSTKVYMSNLKMWFRKLWTKEQFDFECRRLFTPEQQHLHNEFFLAILNKITLPYHLPQNNASSETKTGRKRKRSIRGSERNVFEPVELFDYLPEENPEIRQPDSPLPQPRFAAQELFLPDTGLILGRLLIAAWENELTHVDEEICDLLVMAVQIFLKNILTSIIKARKNYRTTGSGRFFYDVGCAYKDPCIKNTATRQIIDDHPFELNREITLTNVQRRATDDGVFLTACEDMQQTSINGLITITDLYNALQDRNLIPCQSIYANNIERITQQLH